MSFLADYQRVRDSQPRISLMNLNHQNSEYCNYCADNKDSYMLYGSEKNNGSMYGTWNYFCNDTVDSDFSYKCELCYQCLDCTNCFNCNFCQDCENVNDSEFCYDCIGCTNCFGCVGLRHKEYYVFNEECQSKADYEQRVRNWKQKGMGAIYKAFGDLQRTVPRKYMHERQIENCTGDYVYTSRNTLHSFDVRDMEDCLYMSSSIGCKDCIDCANSYFGCEESYEVMSSINIKNCFYSYAVFDSQDLWYCDQMWNCHDCIGSSTLKRKEYHILNQPYTKENYFKERDRIMAEMKRSGQFGMHLPSLYPDPLVYPLS